jgi:hypothetical protein
MAEQLVQMPRLHVPRRKRLAALYCMTMTHNAKGYRIIDNRFARRNQS